MNGATFFKTASQIGAPIAGIALRQGVAAAQAGDFDRARELLQQVTTESPEDVVAWYWLAISSPSADAAIPCLRRVLGIAPSHPQAREALARLLVAEARVAATAGRPVEARALASEATGVAPESQSTWLALAALATDHVERIDALRHITALMPEDRRFRTQLRQALLARAVMIATTDRAEARQRFREAAALDPLDTRVWQALATLADSREEALQSLRELVRIAPEHHHGRNLLHAALVEDARAHAQEGRQEDACQRWREAIEVGAGDVESWLGLAAATPDQEEAARAVETAYAFDPVDARAIAALNRLRGPQSDPATAAAPDNAFSRFEALDGSPALDLPDYLADQGDYLLDEFSKRTEATTLAVTAEPDTVSAAPIETVATETSEIAAPLETPAGAVPPVTTQPEPVPSVSGTVMVVDDSPTIRKILGLTLERAGYTVLAESDGEAALERLQQVVPNVILLDISMPKLDGYEVCKRIKLDPRTAGVPVIMLSGKGAFFDKVKGHMAGATEYLTKPFETPAVLAVVTSHCQTTTEAHHG